MSVSKNRIMNLEKKLENEINPRKVFIYCIGDDGYYDYGDGKYKTFEEMKVNLGAKDTDIFMDMPKALWERINNQI